MKTLLVTGASSDMAASLFNLVADRYDTVWAHYRSSADAVRRLSDRYGDKIVPVQADFADADSIVRMIDTIRQDGRVPDHIVLMSAEELSYKKFAKTEPEDFTKALTIGPQSAVRLLQAFLPGMKKRGSGRVVFLLSVCTEGVPPKYMSSYVTGKYAMLGLMRALAAEYEGRGVSVNAVSPDMTDTRYLDTVPALIKETAAASMPAGRLLTPEETARVMQSLLADDSSANGQNLIVTGGG